MSKRNQINITLDETEMHNVSEYCRVHNMTPQAFFRAGGKRLITEDLLERKADLMTMQSLKEIEQGLDQPVDTLFQMIEEDSIASEKSIKDSRVYTKDDGQ